MGTMGGGMEKEQVAHGQECSEWDGIGSFAKGLGRTWWIVFIVMEESGLLVILFFWHNRKRNHGQLYIRLNLLFQGEAVILASGGQEYVCHVWNRVPATFNVSWPPGAIFAILPWTSLFATHPKRKLQSRPCVAQNKNNILQVYSGTTFLYNHVKSLGYFGVITSDMRRLTKKFCVNDILSNTMGYKELHSNAPMRRIMK